jgi:hypothetical protein
VRRLDLQRRLGFGRGREGVRPNPFTRQPATIARVAEHYYELRSPGIETIGGNTKAPLVAWARSHGFAPTFVDERKRELRARPFSNPKGRKRANPGAWGTPEQEAAVDRLRRYADEFGLVGRGAGFQGTAVYVDFRDPKKRPSERGAALRAIIFPTGVVQGPARLVEANSIMLERDYEAGGNPRRKRHPSGRFVRTAGVRGRRRSNPRESEVALARRTFRRLNEIEPGKVTRVRTARGAPKVLAKLGTIREIIYDSDKYAGSPHNPKGKVLTYSHKTRRPRPVLATDPTGREVHIVGGRMHPTPDGLVN